MGFWVRLGMLFAALALALPAQASALNAPTIDAATQINETGAPTTIVFSVSDAPGRSLKIEVFRHASDCGQVNVAPAVTSTTVITDAAGAASGRIDTTGVAYGNQVALQATDTGTLETSGLSACKAVALPPFVSIAGQEIAENAGTVNLTLTRAFQGPNPGSHTASLHLKTTDTGTATPGSDFVPLDTIVRWPAGVEVVTVPIQIIDDTTVDENQETIGLAFSDFANLDPFPLQNPPSVRILNDDTGAPTSTIGFAAGEVSVSESAAAAQLTIVRSGDTSAPLEITGRILEDWLNFGLSHFGHVAIFDEDFVAGDLKVTMPAGATSAQMSLPLKNDAVVEPDEYLSVDLHAAGVNVVDGQKEVTIVDEDAASKLDAVKVFKQGQKVTISGTASGKPGRVDVAIVQFTKRKTTCRIVKANGGLKRVKGIKSLTACAGKGFAAAKFDAAKAAFTRTLAKGLPKGSYTVFSRARSTSGSVETAFGVEAGNQATLKIGR